MNHAGLKRSQVDAVKFLWHHMRPGPECQLEISNILVAAVVEAPGCPLGFEVGLLLRSRCNSADMAIPIALFFRLM